MPKKSSVMKRTIPSFKTDKEAERFVDEADLSGYSLKGRMVTFELKPKDKTVSLRLPEALLDQVKARATKAGIPTQRFMRLALEKAVKEEV